MKEDYISVKDFSHETGWTTKHVYEMGEKDVIVIEKIAGFKMIDKVKYHPREYMKNKSNDA